MTKKTIWWIRHPTSVQFHIGLSLLSGYWTLSFSFPARHFTLDSLDIWRLCSEMRRSA